MKAYRGSGVIAIPFLISELLGGEWSASSPSRFTPGRIAPILLELKLRMGIKTYGIEVPSSGLTFVPNFVKVGQLVKNLELMLAHTYANNS
jgi:hypothetical protein